MTHCCCHYCWNTPPTASLCSHPRFDLHKCSASIDECQWISLFFSAQRNSVTPLCFICTSMSDTILSDCPSAAICCIVTTCDRILAGRFSLCCYITNICLWLVGQRHKIGGITFGAALIQLQLDELTKYIPTQSNSFYPHRELVWHVGKLISI